LKPVHVKKCKDNSKQCNTRPKTSGYGKSQPALTMLAKNGMYTLALLQFGYILCLECVPFLKALEKKVSAMVCFKQTTILQFYIN
jgi:hypothetical protein